MASTEADESPKQNGETTGEPTESKAAETTSAGNVVSAVDKTAETKDEKPEEKASKNDDENEKPEAEEEKGQQEKDKDDDSGQEEENDNVSLNTADSRTRGGDTTDDGRKDSVFGSHIPDHLDEDTLRGMKDYLQNCRDTTELDDDEITSMMIRLDRNVENRARYAADFHPLEEIVDDEKIRKEVYKEEEEYMVSHEFIKEMHVKLQKKKKKRGYPDKRTLNWVKRAAGFNRKDHHLAHAAIGGFDDDDDEDGNDGGPKKIVPRRYTRGMARSTRMKKKEEFIFKDTIGLKSLLHCIKEMEPEQGPFPVPFECDAPKERHRRSRAHSDRKKKKRSRVASDDEEDDDDDDDSYIEGNKRSKARDRPSGPMVYPLVARFSEEDYNDGLARGDFLFGENRDILLIKITVDGEHVEEDDADSHTMHERKRELKRLRDRQYQKRKREQKLREQDRKSGSKYTTPIRSNSNKRQREDESHEDDERRQRRKSQKSRKSDGASRNLISARTGKNSISLALLDWQRRQMWSPNSGRRLAREDDQDISTKVAIPTQLAKCGIGYRLPPWESVNTASNMVEQSNYVEPPRGRHSDEIYAAWTHKLINCLNGSTRSWAIHEFFYSDIDRAWYDANPFVKDISKLGILPTTKLTRREWSVVRRMIPNRPRRFSKRFIFSQLRERNKYRDMVRELQQNPDQTNHTGYAIPAPIKVGATVTAFNKKYLILHRGTVLFYDAYSSRYLIQFERKELGTEFVSDTQVSSHGVPEILMPPAPSILTGAPEETALSNYIRVGELPYGTSFGPLSGTWIEFFLPSCRPC